MKFCRKEKQDCCRAETGGNKGLCLLKGMAVALAVSCIFFIAYGIVLTYTALAESTSGDFALHTTFWRMMAVALAGGAAGGLLGIHKIS